MRTARLTEDQFERAYRRLAPLLERAVTRATSATRPVVEEACQAAWSRLYNAEVQPADPALFNWLSTTAVREAWRQARKQRRELTLVAQDESVELGQLIEFPAREPGPDQVAELRSRLGAIGRLPVRQRRMVWLQGLGYDYAEIAEETGDTLRTVERQIRRAKRTLEDLVA
jgi:RNA polymerase sigma factor (sigma-70 family)